MPLPPNPPANHGRQQQGLKRAADPANAGASDPLGLNSTRRRLSAAVATPAGPALATAASRQRLRLNAGQGSGRSSQPAGPSAAAQQDTNEQARLVQEQRRLAEARTEEAVAQARLLEARNKQMELENEVRCNVFCCLIVCKINASTRCTFK